MSKTLAEYAEPDEHSNPPMSRCVPLSTHLHDLVNTALIIVSYERFRHFVAQGPSRGVSIGPDAAGRIYAQHRTLYIDDYSCTSSTLVLPTAQPCNAGLCRVERVRLGDEQPFRVSCNQACFCFNRLISIASGSLGSVSSNSASWDVSFNTSLYWRYLLGMSLPFLCNL
jgi:hypothetical protein